MKLIKVIYNLKSKLYSAIAVMPNIISNDSDLFMYHHRCK